VIYSKQTDNNVNFKLNDFCVGI